MTRHVRKRTLTLFGLSAAAVMSLSWMAPAFAQINVPGTDVSVGGGGGGSDSGGSGSGGSGDVGGAVGGVTDAVGGVTDGATNTTDPIKETVDKTTDAVNNTGGSVGGAVGGAVKDTTNAVEETTKSTKDTVSGTVDQVNQGANDTLSGAGVDNPLNGLRDEKTRKGARVGGDGGSKVGPATRKQDRRNGASGGHLGLAERRARDGRETMGALDGRVRNGHADLRTELAAATQTEGPAILEQIAVAAREAAKQLGFPLALTLMVVAFLIVQGRIDRKDAKLALAPIDSEQDFLSFS